MSIIFAKTLSKLMKKIPLQRFISALILLLLVLPTVSFTSKLNTPAFTIKTIVIDAGHGGKFHGASGKYSREQDVTLKVAFLLGKAIEENLKDVKVIYTRSSDTELSGSLSVDLRERINIANRAKADLLISIHCNSMGYARVRTGYRKDSKGRKVPVYSVRPQSPSTKGVETYVAGFDRLDEQEAALGEYAVLKEDYKEDVKFDSKDPEVAIALSLKNNELRKKSIQLATFIQDQYIATGRVDRGVQEKSLAVLRTAIMPAVLTEIGFISNPEEEDYINSEAGENEIVSCLLKAIQSYKKLVELE
jgi:N-acetylmuramoyl-L-alanine amidase